MLQKGSRELDDGVEDLDGASSSCSTLPPIGNHPSEDANVLLAGKASNPFFF